MSSKHFYISFVITVNALFGANNVLARNYQYQEPLCHDSIISLSNHAFSLIFTNPDSALIVANLAYEISLQQKDSLAIAQSLTSIAAANWAEAKYNLALKLYFEALSKYEALQDTTGILRCYNNIAEVYKKLENISNAKRYLYKVNSLYKLYFKVRQPILNYLNFAELYMDEKNYDSASFYLHKAKSAPDDQITLSYLATINYDYAVLNKDTANYGMAKTFIEQSIYFAQMDNNERRLAESYNILGEILIETGNYDTAIESFEKSLALAIKLNHEHLELRIQKNLYVLEFEKGNTINAITHILRYTELKDKIYTISISRQSAEFEKVYEFKKIEKENSLLQLKQEVNDSIIKYQIGFIIIALIALVIAIYLLIAINKQRKILKQALVQLEEKSQIVETQKLKIEKQSKDTHALNKELTLLNKNLESRAHEIAREIEVKNKKMNKYAFMNAHKLRAPIASILGLINLFDKNLSVDDEKTMIRMLKESADKLDDVVHEIKDVIDE